MNIFKTSVFFVVSLVLFGQMVQAQERFRTWQCLLPSVPGARVLEIKYFGDGDVPCQAFDRNGLSIQRIANYQNSSGQCEAHVSSLVATLERGGYLCIPPDSMTHRFSTYGDGFNYSPYWYALIDLSVEDGSINGVLRPLLGDLTPPRKVTGNFVEGVAAEIEIDFADGYPMKLTLQGDPSSGFYGDRVSPPPTGGMSEREMTIYQTECGPFNREIFLRYYNPRTDERTTAEEVLQAIDEHPEFFSTIVTSHWYTGETDQYGDPEYIWIEKELKEFVLQPAEMDHQSRTAVVEDGQETSFVQAARRTGIFSEANLLFGVCGAVHSNAVLVPVASNLLAGVDRTGLIELLRSGLESHVSSSSNNRGFRIENHQFQFFNDDPYGGRAVFPVAMSSEVSRGVAGKWDSFELVVRFGRQGSKSIVLDMYADDAKTVQRGALNRVPDIGFFSEDIADQEGRIADNLAAAFVNWCKSSVEISLIDDCEAAR